MSLFLLRSGQARTRLAQAGVVFAVTVFAAGCGNGYRPVITPINPTGPAAQPNSLVAVVSSTGPTTPGVATIIDYSGDTIVAQATIGPGPLSFTADETGSNGYTVNSDGTITNFSVSSQLQTKNVQFTTLPTTANVVNLFSPSGGLWASDLDGNVADVLTGFPASLQAGHSGGAHARPSGGAAMTIMERAYIISQNFTDTTATAGVTCNVSPRTVIALGEADAVEETIDSVSARIPLGKCPVFGVETTNGQRLFVLNRGDDTITVINSADNTLDACTPFLNQSGQLVTCHPTLPLSTSAVTATGITPPNGTAGMPAIAGPVYAEYNAITAQLIVSDYDGNAISVIDVSLDEYGNDSQTFGTTYTIPVGTNPASVTRSGRWQPRLHGQPGRRHRQHRRSFQPHAGEDGCCHRPSAHRRVHSELALRQGLRGFAGQPLPDHHPHRPGHHRRQRAGAGQHHRRAHNQPEWPQRQRAGEQPQAGLRRAVLSAADDAARGLDHFEDLQCSSHYLASVQLGTRPLPQWSGLRIWDDEWLRTGS